MPQIEEFVRTLILGNSGSGKSWLSERLAAALQVRAVDLDSVHWEPSDYRNAREKQLAIEMVRQISAGSTWVIEGVYGWLAQEALPQATALIWLDIPVADCLKNIGGRGPRRGGDDTAFTALLRWAEEYPTRQSSSSFAGHERLFQDFSKRRLRLRSHGEVNEFLAAIQRL
ncbi:MAG: hypothetical protein EOQ34_27060 [Mesorhizobium sp.]|nr:AAA family ATPase [Mesorhizobium sp.]RWF67935.1 MAG: hypothetical protein EOQ34_27060 [Mesorhizobium sp.]